MASRHVELEVRLIDDLLDVTRVMAGKLQLQLVSCDVHEAIRAAVRVCALPLGEKRITLDLDLAAQASRLRGDQARLAQIFWNLLGNAAKFTPANGRVRIRTHNEDAHTPGGWFVAEIADTGIGMSPDVIARAFALFEQGDRSTTRRHGGLGIGLAICKALVELHRGRIEAQSSGAGQGSTFIVRLPLAPETIRFPRRPSALGAAC